MMKLPNDLAPVVVFAINRFGSGDHPAADTATLAHFDQGYARECLEKLLRSTQPALDRLAAK